MLRGEKSPTKPFQYSMNSLLFDIFSGVVSSRVARGLGNWYEAQNPLPTNTFPSRIATLTYTNCAGDGDMNFAKILN
ncbi:hypothetical protein M758_UG084700 [Ceratodon purpureus]|nr:hypothetical protein M758_UG084700 [Ceratodon purpureus]